MHRSAFCLVSSLFILASAETPQNSFERVGDPVLHDASTAIDPHKAPLSEPSYFAFFNFSPIDMLIPRKLGLTIGTVRSVDKTWEVELLQGSIAVPFVVKDLGEMTDRRVSLVSTDS